jgi:predicted glycoside hydrolase/deacetylase ChbG (UPF0249 family)
MRAMTKRLALRADDLGYTEAVNYGMAYALRNCGLPVSVGFMMNMPWAEQGYRLIEDLDNLCLGIHTNITIGKPLCDPADVPSLVREDGTFKPSALYRVATEDPAALEDVERECEAQYQAFTALVGREPDYVDIHAVESVNFVRGVANVAANHGKPTSALPGSGEPLHIGKTDVWFRVSLCNAEDPLEDLRAIAEAPEDGNAHMLVFHPGYVDAQLMRTSSVNVPRTVDAETLGSPELRDFVHDHGFELITYRDL